jgi:membrane-bound lytic murein transglycosylase D
MRPAEPTAYPRHSRLLTLRRQTDRWARLLSLILVTQALLGCSQSLLRTTPPPDGLAAERQAAPTPLSETRDSDPADMPPAVVAVTPPDFWHRLRHGFRFDPTRHPRIDRELRRLRSAPHHVESLLQRGRPYFFLILEEVESRGLPAELVLLPAVESAYRPTARSYSGAAGLWQIMPATGRQAGLRQDDWYDGRRDIFDSTTAALEILEDLSRRFDGDWLHALAAYNAGAARVSRAIHHNRRHGVSTDYWELELPRETDNYVPRLLALVEIIADPGRHGIDLPETPDAPLIDRIDAGARTDLRLAARLSDIEPEQILQLNAGYKAMATTPEGPHWIVVPVSVADRLTEELAGLDPAERLPARDVRHRIRRGETLGGIAQRYGVSVASLKRANHVSGHLIQAGKSLVIPGRLHPLSDAEPLIAVAEPSVEHRIQHRVRRGDSLYEIARRYRVSVEELRRWNGIRGRLIKPGQRLTIFVPPRRRTL